MKNLKQLKAVAELEPKMSPQEYYALHLAPMLTDDSVFTINVHYMVSLEALEKYCDDNKLPMFIVCGRHCTFSKTYTTLHAHEVSR